MNEYKSGLFKVVLVPSSATRNGEEFYAVVSQTYCYDARVIDIKQNLLKEDAEDILKQITYYGAARTKTTI